MAVLQAAYAAEKAIGHDGSSILQEDVANYQGEPSDSSEKMKALAWQSKCTVEVGTAAEDAGASDRIDEVWSS